MKIKDLIGYKLLRANEKEIIIGKDNSYYTLYIEDDEGDCCGYNEITASFDTKENPVITDITFEKNEEGDGEQAKITFFGLNKQIGTIETYSSSGSGWNYGACVTICCKALNLEEIISQW